MGISNQVRKILWAKSGNRCAISKIELVHDDAGEVDSTVIGDECHICAQSEKGPRFDKSLSNEEINSYDNLILLSKNYHKVVDDNPVFYTVEKLKKIKAEHEKWVKDTLDIEIKNVKSKNDPSIEFPYLKRITNGNELVDVIYKTHAYDFDNDELKTAKEVDLVASFLQNLQDLGEISSYLEVGELVQNKFEMGKELEVLEENGFWVFGDRQKTNYGTTKLDVSIIRILRSDNKSIQVINF